MTQAMFETPGKKGRGDLVTLNVTWDVVSKGADVVGIISLGISLVTLLNTRKIRSSMIAHVETSEYRKEIDEQIEELEVFRDLLVKDEGAGLNSQFFLKLISTEQTPVFAAATDSAKAAKAGAKGYAGSCAGSAPQLTWPA